MTRPAYSITFRGHNWRFGSLEQALIVAERIFNQTGVIVGIERK